MTLERARELVREALEHKAAAEKQLLLLWTIPSMDRGPSWNDDWDAAALELAEGHALVWRNTMWFHQLGRKALK